MKLRLRASRIELTREARRGIERQARLILGRHAPAVAELRIGLAPGAEPRCEVARCRMRARLHEGEPIRVEHVGANARDAVARTAERLALRLERRGRLGARRASISALGAARR